MGRNGVQNGRNYIVRNNDGYNDQYDGDYNDGQNRRNMHYENYDWHHRYDEGRYGDYDYHWYDPQDDRMSNLSNAEQEAIDNDSDADRNTE